MHSETKERSDQSAVPPSDPYSGQDDAEAPFTSTAPSSARATPEPFAADDLTQPSLPAPKQPFRRVTAVPELVVPATAARAGAPRLGAVVLGAGLLGISICAVLSALASRVPPEVWGTSLLVLTVGVLLSRPALLASRGAVPGDGVRISPTRLAAFVIVPAFGLIALKTGWNSTNLADLRLDPMWAGLIFALIVGEVLQTLAERDPTR